MLLNKTFMIELFSGTATLCSVSKQYGFESSMALNKKRKRAAKLFASTRTGMADPLSRHNRRSTLIVLDEGNLDEEEGYWVQDAETSEKGFVSLSAENEFWVLTSQSYLQWLNHTSTQQLFFFSR